jgi:DNA polymerase I-like protein with 3'-5' exonuclease and polymerase domains
MPAIQRIYARLLERRLPPFLINFVHDALVLEVPGNLLDEVSCLVVDEMTGAFLSYSKPIIRNPWHRDA